MFRSQSNENDLIQNEIFYKNYKFLLKSALSIQAIKQCIGHTLITNLIIQYLPFNNFNPIDPQFIHIHSDVKDKGKVQRKYFQKITSLINKVNNNKTDGNDTITYHQSTMVRDCLNEMLNSGHYKVDCNEENNALLQEENDHHACFETIGYPGFDGRHYT